MKKYFLLAFMSWLSLHPLAAEDISIIAAANSWVFDDSGACITPPALDSKQGIDTKQWSDATHHIRTYFWLSSPGILQVSVTAAVTSGQSVIRCALADEHKDITLTNTVMEVIPVASFTIERPGYQCLEFSGISKTGATFANIVSVQLAGSATVGPVHSITNDVYFGRRGPSVHLGYKLAKETKDICYYYNEVMVPKGNDTIGTYCMANGFGQGYSGMQVNSENERRILFSVWSPFKTDDPKQIPESDRIVLLAKGPDVEAKSFGGEGSGGQSFLRFPWQAGTTYRFLLRGEPNGDDTTTFTCYFYPPEVGKWLLIASFRRPKLSTYLTGWHSFLENFNPKTGATVREAQYANQWARDKQGTWLSVSQARFTADATAHKQARLDYTGGITSDNKFFLRNCGFFSDNTPVNSTFTCKPATSAPDIDLEHLPQH